MMTISVFIGSTRQCRFSEKPAQWILHELGKREGIEARLLGLRDFPVPFFDKPMPPAGVMMRLAPSGDRLGRIGRLLEVGSPLNSDGNFPH